MWLTERERVTLMVLGLLALVGLGLLLWLQRRPPIAVASGAPPLSFDGAQDGALSGVERAPYAEWDAKLQEARQINLNHATAAELERLPEVGPSLAQRIIAYRQAHGGFRGIEDLLDVPGIGPKTLQALREYVTVQSHEAQTYGTK